MPRVFISYRREDTAADANALYQSLSAEFGADQVFMDVDDVAIGVNWRTAVQHAVRTSDVVLVLMGAEWECSEAVEVELATALEAGLPMLPVLVRGADIAALTRGLRDGLAELGDLNAATLSYTSWARDMQPVFEAIRDLPRRSKPIGASRPAGPVSDVSARWTKEPRGMGMVFGAAIEIAGRHFDLTTAKLGTTWLRVNGEKGTVFNDRGGSPIRTEWHIEEPGIDGTLVVSTPRTRDWVRVGSVTLQWRTREDSTTLLEWTR